jgi:hypothetical protein
MDERSRTTHYNSITTEMIGSVKEGQLQKNNKNKRGKLKIKETVDLYKVLFLFPFGNQLLASSHAINHRRRNLFFFCFVLFIRRLRGLAEHTSICCCPFVVLVEN